MLYPMAPKNFGPGHYRVVQSRPDPGHDPCPGTKITSFESPRVKEYNGTSKTVKYEPSYGQLNFHYSSVPLYYMQLQILKNQFLGVDQKLSPKGVIAPTG